MSVQMIYSQTKNLHHYYIKGSLLMVFECIKEKESVYNILFKLLPFFLKIFLNIFVPLNGFCSVLRILDLIFAISI